MLMKYAVAGLRKLCLVVLLFNGGLAARSADLNDDAVKKRDITLCQGPFGSLTEIAQQMCADPDLQSIWHRLLELAAESGPDLLGQRDRVIMGIDAHDPGKFLAVYAGACGSTQKNGQPAPSSIEYQDCVLDWLNAGTMDDYPLPAPGVPDKYLKTPPWIYHDFHASRYPFQPTLLTNRQPELCALILKALRDDFRTIHREFRSGQFGDLAEPDVGESSARLSIAVGNRIAPSTRDSESDQRGKADALAETDREEPILEDAGTRFVLTNDPLTGDGIVSHLRQYKADAALPDECSVQLGPAIAWNPAVRHTGPIIPPADLAYFVERIELLGGVFAGMQTVEKALVLDRFMFEGNEIRDGVANLCMKIDDVLPPAESLAPRCSTTGTETITEAA
jgi:hypothetical protein